MKLALALADEGLSFLRQQRLAPIPRNYALAFWAREGSNPELGKAVKDATDGGVRMTQDEADKLFALHLGGAWGASASAAADRDLAGVRHQTRRLAEIAADAAVATGDFNRDLRARFDELGTDASDTSAIVAMMIERSERAERELAATTLQVEKLRAELDSARDDATKDALTGLSNRRALDAHLADLATDGGDRLIAICDIDHFKSVNDRYGHVVGDRVLKTVASSLAGSCTPHLVGRWGGEEFLVVMRSVALADGIAILEAALADLGGRHFKLRETDEPMGAITFSAGVALARGGAREGAAAVGRADELLYKAKADGRNRVNGSPG